MTAKKKTIPVVRAAKHPKKDGVLADIHLERKGELLDLKFTVNEAAYTAGCDGLAKVLAGFVPMLGAAQTMFAKEAAATVFPDDMPKPPPHLDPVDFGKVDAEFEPKTNDELLAESLLHDRQGLTNWIKMTWKENDSQARRIAMLEGNCKENGLTGDCIPPCGKG